MKSFRPMLAAALLLSMPLLPASAAEDPARHAELPAAAPAANSPMDRSSIYQLDSTWTSADGKAIRLSELRGKVRVLAIFYSSCQYACPIIVGRMKSVQLSLPENLHDRVGLVLVSMDPAVDTPEKLRDYRSRLELTGDWTLLHGDDGDIRELAALLGFRYRQEKDGGYSHSNLITVLDREGRIAHQSTGLDSDASDIVKAVTPLVTP